MKKNTFLKHFQVYNMIKYVFEAFSSLKKWKTCFWSIFKFIKWKSTFLKRFKFYKMKKHVFDTFSVLKHEKTRLWNVFKFTKCKNTFLTCFQVLQNEKVRFGNVCIACLQNEKNTFWNLKRYKIKARFWSVFIFTKWKNMLQLQSFSTEVAVKAKNLQNSNSIYQN